MPQIDAKLRQAGAQTDRKYSSLLTIGGSRDCSRMRGESELYESGGAALDIASGGLP
jgi:hypothetical protein